MKQTKVWMLIKAIFVKNKKTINDDLDLDMERYTLKIIGTILFVIILFTIILSVFNIAHESINELKR